MPEAVRFLVAVFVETSKSLHVTATLQCRRQDFNDSCVAVTLVTCCFFADSTERSKCSLAFYKVVEYFYGIAGYYGLMAAREGMIGLTGTNARPSIAPTFGVENMLGTNPLTFVIPTDEEFPFFLDCATSVSQRGKFEYYAKVGKDLPKGWCIDREGNSKTNSVEVLDDLVKGKAALAPLGGIGEETAGYKGYGYATVVEILSSALQCGGYMKALTGLDENGNKKPYRLGHFFIAINIETFQDLDVFKKNAGNLLRDLRNSQKMPGHDRIYTAGEKEYENFLVRSKNGVPIPDSLWEEMIGVTKDYKLDKFYKLFGLE